VRAKPGLSTSVRSRLRAPYALVFIRGSESVSTYAATVEVIHGSTCSEERGSFIFDDVLKLLCCIFGGLSS